MVNAFIGSFGGKVNTSANILLTESLPQSAYIKWTTQEYQKDDGSSQICTVVPIGKEDSPDFYAVKTSMTRPREEGFVPIYNQILDIEAMELYKIKTLLKKQNGKMVYLNTDNAIALFKDEKSIDKLRNEMVKHFWDDEKKAAKYKEESDLIKKAECGEVANKEIKQYSCHVQYRNKIQDPGNNDFVPLAKELIELKESFQIQAMAGCGKTYLLKEIMKQLNEKEISIYVLDRLIKGVVSCLRMLQRCIRFVMLLHALKGFCLIILLLTKRV